MKKFTFSALLLTFSAGLNAQTAVQDSVIMGASYANEVYYILEDGAKSPQAANDWNLGFSTGSTSSVIFSNAANSVVKLWPDGTNDDFETAIDVSGFGTWPELVNDPADFNKGSFNQNALGMIMEMGVPSSLDDGWGVYSFSDHIMRGDSIYVVKVGSDFYKVDFIKKELGTITLRYASVESTTAGTQVAVPAATYGTKNFVFFNLADGQVKDRELEGWDMWFTKYHDNYGGAGIMAVTGILTNPKLQVAIVNAGAGNQATYTDLSSAAYSGDKNVIGDGYKSVDYTTGTWNVTNADVYYLQNANGDIWKWYPTAFVGTSQGKTVFYKQKVAFAGLTEEGTQFVEIYPNPAKDQLTIAFDSKANTADIIVRNQMGQVVVSENFNTITGVTQQKLDISALANGVYYVEINQNGNATVKNVVKY